VNEFLFVVLFISWIASIGLGATVAPESRTGLGALLGVVYGPFGVLIAALLREKRNPRPPERSAVENVGSQSPAPPSRHNEAREAEMPGVYVIGGG
jgi:hypothetical protein